MSKIMLTLCTLFLLSSFVNAESWDLARQWSDAKNPNGVWSYEQAPNLSGSFTTVATQSGEQRIYQIDPKEMENVRLLSERIDEWLEPDFSGPQGVWRVPGGIPGLCQSAGLSNFDFPKGRIGGHSPFLVRWTAPKKTTVDVKGAVWSWRRSDHITGISCGKTSKQANSYVMLFDEFPIPGPVTSFNSDNPLRLAHVAQLQSKEVGKLKHISVEKGDSIWLLVKMRHGSDDFVGIDLTISEVEGNGAEKGCREYVAKKGQLFSLDRLSSQWVQMEAQGFSKPVTGVIYRKDTPATNGLSLGGIDTGCIDLETSGLWGMSTIFNTHIPRGGPMNLPFLGISVGGETWVLCDPEQAKPGEGNFQPPFSYNFPHHMDYMKRWGDPVNEPYRQELNLEGVQTANEIHYWGHFPVADMEYDISAPVSVGMRAWAPFIPGDIKTSMIPGIVFEVQIRNTSKSRQNGTVAFSFPGPSVLEAGTERFERDEFKGKVRGVEVTSPNEDYALGVIGEKKVRIGGELGADGAAWAKIAKRLPKADTSDAGSSVAVDFKLKAGQTKVVRYVLSWYGPTWKAKGKNWAEGGNTFEHMYAKYYPNAKDTAILLGQQNKSLLKRILAWQAAVYDDTEVPGWLADSMINSLYMIAECGMWAQAKSPLPDWVREEDGLFGLNECPRTCPQIECIPCGFYGNLPLVYFFPELMLSTYRGYAGYMFENGAAPWVWGGWTAGQPPVDFANPVMGYQWTTNGISLAGMLDRYLLCHGEKDKDFVKEFHPIVKKNMTYTVGLSTIPEYSLGQRILMMPDGRHAEWFEAGNPQWFGMTTHAGALHLAQLRIAKRFADEAGDAEFSAQCQQWLDLGMAALEENLWNESYYLNCFDPLNNRKDDLVFAFQLDGQWVTEFHGLEGVFRKDRVQKTLETVKRCNAAISQYGVVNYAYADGKPAPVGGYGTYSWFPPEVLMLSMNYMYEGQKDYAMEIAKRAWGNIICGYRYTWDMPNIIRGDMDTGERGYMNGGHDYYQDMMIWSLPAAMAGEDLSAPCKSGGLVDRILRAATGDK